MPAGTATVLTAVRVLSSAAVFGLLGSLAGEIGAVVGAGVGLAIGILHAWVLVSAGSYPAGPRGWLLLAVDHTWSLLNTVAGSLFLAVTMATGNTPDRVMSAGRSTIVLQRGIMPGFATTIGPVEAGTDSTIARHEYVHVLQARIFGPLYLPLVVLHYVLATIIPYWLLYHDHSNRPIRSFRDYFMRGVYPHAWNEEWAYAVEGSPP